MNVIWRFKLEAPLNEVSTVQVPHGAGKVLGAERVGAFWVWMIVDPDGPLLPKPFLVARTGAPRADTLLGDSTHVASLDGGFHVFECPAGTHGYVAPAAPPEAAPQHPDLGESE